MPGSQFKENIFYMLRPGTQTNKHRLTRENRNIKVKLTITSRLEFLHRKTACSVPGLSFLPVRVHPLYGAGERRVQPLYGAGERRV